MNFVRSTTTDTFKRYTLGKVNRLIVKNDSLAQELKFSFDGKTQHGILTPSDFVVFDCVNPNDEDMEIWFKTTVALQFAVYRFWAW